MTDAPQIGTYISLTRAARDLDLSSRALRQMLADRGLAVVQFGPRTPKVAVEDIAALVKAAKQPASEGV